MAWPTRSSPAASALSLASPRAVGLVAGFLRIAGGFDFLHALVTLRSLVISYCLGVVVTFLTVVFSALQVSSVNIVAAIRGNDDDGSSSPSAPRCSRSAPRWSLRGCGRPRG